jgi:hypothetical protein
MARTIAVFGGQVERKTKIKKALAYMPSPLLDTGYIEIK